MNFKYMTYGRDISRPDADGSRHRVLFLDMARAIMLGFVILAHTEASFMSTFVTVALLPVFWLASGYLSSGRVDFRRKALTLLVPYVVMTVLCFIFTMVYMGWPLNLHEVFGAFYARFVFRAAPPGPGNEPLMAFFNSVLWFLPSLFTAWCFFALLSRLRTLPLQLAGVAVCLALTYASTFLPVLLPWSLDTAPAFASVMIVGRWLRQYRLMELKYARWAMILAGTGLYVLFNYLVGPENTSIRDFGNSIWLWYPAAVSGGVVITTICRLFDNTTFCKVAAWFNNGALFIFGMQLVFIKFLEETDAFWRVESWKIRAILVLILCFFGGKLLSFLYNLALRAPKTHRKDADAVL